jgi:hypothetical protein
MKKVSDDRKQHSFKTFPEFSKLTLADKRHYEELVKEYPPVADISFVMLMIWWNWLDSCAVSMLNGNLVISYWLPGEERYSGLSILGTKQIDESICTIFDHLKEKGEPVQLAHVPEFVLSHVQYPELFSPTEERAFDEYIFSVSKFYPLDRVSSFRRRRVKKFLAEIDESRIVVKSLDLTQEENQQLLLKCAVAWQHKKGGKRLNNIARNEGEAIRIAITHADIMDVENTCLFIDGKLSGFTIHQFPSDKRYATGLHVRINPEIPRTFDYLLFAFARQLTDQGVSYLNLKYDLGILSLRMMKLALGPTNYFRKYTLRPNS